MTTRQHLVVDIAVRGGVLLAGQWAFTRIWDAVTAGPHETDIGGGLVGLGLVVLAALVWGALDGRRHELGHLAVTWLGAGLVTGAFVVVAIAVEGGDRGEVLVAMALLGPFMTAVVAGPAVIAGLLTSGLQHRTPAPSRRP